MRHASPDDPLHLDRRAGWPDELRLFLDRYPREAWPSHANLGEMAKFWLGIHDGFRGIGRTLKAGMGDFREGKTEAAAFRSWFRPRFSYMLTGLEHHHQIEDSHFFPLLGVAEPRLVRGFDVLEADHGAIHEAMETTIAAANAFLRASEADRDLMLRSADDYAAAAEALLARLDHHLDDEEDLIIPLILDRGERALGM